MAGSNEELRARLLATEIVRAFEVKLRVWGDKLPNSAVSDFMATVTWANAALARQEEGREAVDREAVLRDYVEDYEFLGETEDGRDACYQPNERERLLIEDAIRGWEALELPATHPTPPASEASQHIEDVRAEEGGDPRAKGEDWAHNNAVATEILKLGNWPEKPTSHQFYGAVIRAHYRLLATHTPQSGNPCVECDAEPGEPCQPDCCCATPAPASPQGVSEAMVERALNAPLGLNTKVRDMLMHPGTPSVDGDKWKQAVIRAALEAVWPTAGTPTPAKRKTLSSLQATAPNNTGVEK